MHQFALRNQPHVLHQNGTPWYDNKIFITLALRNLESFNNLVLARRHAGYKEGERLNEFYVFGGRWHLDTRGNTTRATKDPFPQKLRVLLPVATRAEFWDFHKTARAFGYIDEESISFSLESRIPPAGIHCTHCKKKWSIEDAHDVSVHSSRETIPLTDFLGQTLGDVKAHYAQRDDAVVLMQRDILIRNDKHIDHSQKYPNAEKSWQKGVHKNEGGWLGEKDGVTDLRVIEVGDEGFFNCWKYFHVACRNAHITTQAEAQFKEILRNAGYPKDIMLLPTENLYGSAEYRGPWFLFFYEHACIRIGWRKRVIEIDWSRVQNKELRNELAENFANVESTHTDTVVHAYDTETTTKFLAEIRRILKKASVIETTED